MYLTREPKGRLAEAVYLQKKGGDIMDTYEEFMIIISVAGLIIAILTYHDNKK